MRPIVIDRLSIGRRLREARLAAGFKTAKAFATTQTMAQSTYSQYETGHRAFNADKLAHLCVALQIDAHWLLFGRVPVHDNLRLLPRHNSCPANTAEGGGSVRAEGLFA